MTKVTVTSRQGRVRSIREIFPNESIRQFMRLSISEVNYYFRYLTDINLSPITNGHVCNEAMLGKKQFGFHREHFQLPCSIATRKRRRAYFEEQAWAQKVILLMGDDDLLALELAERGFKDIWVEDCDLKILTLIENQTKHASFKPKLRQSDFSQLEYMPPCQADVVCLDPPYNFIGTKTFILAALKAFGDSRKGHLILMINPTCLTTSEWAEINSLLIGSGWNLKKRITHFNLYPIRGFSALILRVYFQIWKRLWHLRQKNLFFASDMFHFERAVADLNSNRG